jgi:hypothetical protein
MTLPLLLKTMKPDITADDIYQEWLAALRSDSYRQCTRQLRKGNTFCVQGVLCDIYHTLTGHGTWINNSFVCEGVSHQGGPPSAIRRLLKLGFQRVTALSQQNDAGMTFPELADWIETKLVNVPE